MSTTFHAPHTDDDKSDKGSNKRRAPWRMRLIEAERGFSFGFRSGSALFGHIFFCLVLVITGLTLGLRFWGWTALVVAMACGMAAELFHHAIRVLAENFAAEQAEKATKLSAAGMVVMMIGAGAVIVFVLGSRLMLMLS